MKRRRTEMHAKVNCPKCDRLLPADGEIAIGGGGGRALNAIAAIHVPDARR